jgi:hypothetical protein
MPLPTHLAKEIARLMRDPDALRDERGRMPPSGWRGHYDPNQPRVPAGQSGGGQWTDADAPDNAFNNGERPQLAQFSPNSPCPRASPSRSGSTRSAADFVCHMVSSKYARESRDLRI